MEKLGKYSIPCWIVYESHIFNTNCIAFHDLFSSMSCYRDLTSYPQRIARSLKINLSAEMLMNNLFIEKAI